MEPSILARTITSSMPWTQELEPGSGSLQQAARLIRRQRSERTEPFILAQWITRFTPWMEQPEQKSGNLRLAMLSTALQQSPPTALCTWDQGTRREWERGTC